MVNMVDVDSGVLNETEFFRRIGVCKAFQGVEVPNGRAYVNLTPVKEYTPLDFKRDTGPFVVDLEADYDLDSISGLREERGCVSKYYRTLDELPSGARFNVFLRSVLEKTFRELSVPVGVSCSLDFDNPLGEYSDFLKIKVNVLILD